MIFANSITSALDELHCDLYDLLAISVFKLVSRRLFSRVTQVPNIVLWQACTVFAEDFSLLLLLTAPINHSRNIKCGDVEPV